ncbi:MAG TPA: alpha-2-macroglobulin family protein, partial [Anaerolineales bacterium]|nr:alpha-2-macroglobulin family protein [Anaerolineales bacterium]
VNAWQPTTEGVLRESYWWGATIADSYLRVDRTQILVDATGKELGIDIETDKQTYEPGEKVTATIRVTDAQGNPAAAELSLAVVDEAIFGLANPFEASIFTAFYGPRKHTVGTFDSMEPTRYIPGEGGGGGDGNPPETRQDFLDTSAWLPVIRTDENGQGAVTFDLPDNTTSWRLTVKAVTLNHQVGEAKTNIETKKEVFLRPILPRVLTRGDKALLTSFIHNYSEVEKTLTVELQADGLILEDDANQIVSLKPGEVLPIGWRVLVDRATPTRFKVIARDGDKVLDAVEMPVLIQPAAVLDVQNQSGEFSGTLALPLMLPDVDMETSQVTLSLNQSVSGTLLNGLDYLIGYPYGCVEQTMSRALPNAVVARAVEQLGVGGSDLSKRLDPYIQASITKLYSLQHSDGGWGWWLYDSSTPYQTAWVLFGLGLIERAGYEVEPKVIDAAVQNLNYHFYNRDNDPRTTAFILYSLAMAGRGNLEETQKLVDASINELDPFSQAALASALNQMGKTEQAREILTLLSKSALEKNGEVYWPQPTHDGEYNSKTMSSTTRTTAMVLLAFAEIEPQHELIPGMVKYLAAQREGVYGWGTTNETTFAILALTQYLVSQENTVEPTPYQVNVNGKELFKGILEAGNTSAQLKIPTSELTAGVNSILVSTQGGRPIYFDLSTKYDLLQNSVEAAGSIKVTRQYLDVETKKIITSFVPGQLVKVQVIVQMPENGYFFAIEDHLPGGLEALNEGLGFSNVYDPYAWEYNGWRDFGYNYKEIRGDRVVFFVSELEKGKHTFTYYARATTVGEFLALPTQVYAMYDFSMWGRSESTEISVK